MGSESSTWLVAFSAPGTCRGKTGRVYTSYVAAAFVGVRVDSGTFRED